MTEKYKDPEWLEQKYLVEGMSQSEMGEIAGCAQSTIGYHLRKHDLDVRDYSGNRKDVKYKDEEWLREKYFEERMTITEIADKTDVTQVAILNQMDRHGIERPDMGTKIKPPKLKHDARGYEIFWVSRGKHLKHHRLLAIAEHGCAEVSDKVVHHKNNIPWDNRPENIEVLTPEEHRRHHAIERKLWDYDRE